MPTRYEARRVHTQAVLAQEVPIRTDGGRNALSAAGDFEGTLPASIALATAADGHAIFEQWGTLIVAIDEGGNIEWYGIVSHIERDGDEVRVEAITPRGYVQGIDYAGPEFVGVKVDPADVVRHMIAHVQSYGTGRPAGTIVVEGSTSVRLGTESDGKAAAAEAEYEAAKAAYETARDATKAARAEATARRAVLSAVSKTASDRVKNAQGTPAKDAARAQGEAEKNAARARVDAQVQVVDDLADAADRAMDARDAANDRRKEANDQVRDDGGAYRLQWWENIDIGKELDDLAAEAPFDYSERFAWDGERVVPYLTIHYPRAGKLRTDLSFEQGINIVSRVVQVHDGSEYANEVQLIGAGEGAGALRQIVADTDWRARRSRSIRREDIVNKSRLNSLARADLRSGRVEVRILSITVVDHPHARIGAWDDGDEVDVTVTTTEAGTFTQRSRIVGSRRITPTKAELTIRPVADYTYGS